MHTLFSVLWVMLSCLTLVLLLCVVSNGQRFKIFGSHAPAVLRRGIDCQDIEGDIRGHVSAIFVENGPLAGNLIVKHAEVMRLVGAAFPLRIEIRRHEDDRLGMVVRRSVVDGGVIQ